MRFVKSTACSRATVSSRTKVVVASGERKRPHRRWSRGAFGIHRARVDVGWGKRGSVCVGGKRRTHNSLSISPDSFVILIPVIIGHENRSCLPSRGWELRSTSVKKTFSRIRRCEARGRHWRFWAATRHSSGSAYSHQFSAGGRCFKGSLLTLRCLEKMEFFSWWMVRRLQVLDRMWWML
ncbi:hypothetical protein GQ53DRAFT_186543 [Thozetella sp. PMI_491]|nr:hypothetical protein GQ53DRAFT_186543 [Thozetella sp. PMI_491]